MAIYVLGAFITFGIALKIYGTKNVGLTINGSLLWPILIIVKIKERIWK